MLDTDLTTRPLGEQERLLNYLHAFGSLIVMQVLHIRGGLESEQLEDALGWLQRQHTMARTHIRYGRLVFRKLPPFVYRQPYFHTKGTEKIPLRVVQGDWQEILADELGKPLRRGRVPRLRLTLVHDRPSEFSHLLICADHACIDAQSCNLLTRELLQYFADPEAMEAKVPNAKGLPPALEAGLPQKSKSGTRAYQPAIRLPNSQITRGRPTTRVASQSIPAEQLTILKTAALANRTSIHGALSAAFLLAMRDKYHIDEMTCLSTVDLRRMCKPALPLETFGCYMDILRTRHKLVGDFWTMAKDVSFKIISALSKDHETVSILKLPEWEVYAKETLPTMRHRRRLDGLAITTAGESGLARKYGHLTLEDVTMAVSLDVFGPSIMVIACERLGALDLSICYATRALSTEDANNLTSRALAHLLAQSAMESGDEQ